MKAEFDDFAPDRDAQLVSMGGICSLLKLLPGQLRTLMEESQIKFAMILDGCGYLRVADAEAIAELCCTVRKEITDAAAKFEQAANN